MSINLSVPKSSEHTELKPRITIVGVGGAGGNAVNNMIRRELAGVDFVVANTDAQSLLQSSTDRRIQLGAMLTEGLGAGSKPDIGAAAAEEASDEVLHQLNGAHMAFIAAGMGGGTGTGAAPVIAKAAREAGILTVAVVTKPFQFEGTYRMSLADAGIEELAQYVDTLIIIPNQNLFRVATENTTFADAFAMADEVLYSGVRGVTDLMVMPGLINLDFADIRSVMSEMGKAMMGTGEATGERRAIEAAEAAIANPLLDDTSMKGAKGVLINITGGPDITLFEVDEAATRVRAEVDQDAYIIIGSAFDTELDGIMRVSVVATGIDAEAFVMPQPRILQVAEAIDRERVLNTDPVVREEPGKVANIQPDAVMPVKTNEREMRGDFGENTEPGTSGLTTIDGRTIANRVDGVSADSGILDTKGGTESDIISLELDAEIKTEPSSMPVAMPRVGGEDVFIPPEPKTVQEPKKGQDPAPFSAAAMVNGRQVTPISATNEQRDRPSLFERVTRTGRAAFGRKVDDAASTEAIATLHTPETKSEDLMPSTSVVLSEPESVKPAATAKPDIVENIEGVPEQSQRNELGLGEASRSNEDDLLDIPAFLRRQAN